MKVTMDLHQKTALLFSLLVSLSNISTGRNSLTNFKLYRRKKPKQSNMRRKLQNIKKKSSDNLTSRLLMSQLQKHKRTNKKLKA